MKHTIHHDLNDGELKAALGRALAQYRAKYPRAAPSLVWRDERRAALAVSMRGLKVTGTIEIRPHALHIQLQVPLVFRVFQGAAIAAIDREARRFIEDAHRERTRPSSP